MSAPSSLEQDLVRLHDIRNASRAALSHARGFTFSRFVRSRKTMASVEREMEIAGEAAGKLSDLLCEHFPSRHWKSLKAMRIILAHKYGDVDPRIVWTTLRDDYSDLSEFVEGILKSLERD